MPSDEENKAIDIVKGITEDDLLNYWEGPEEPYNAIQIVLSLIEKQSKEIEHQIEKRANQRQELAILNAKQIEFNKLVNTVNSYKGQFRRQQKELEELKEKNKDMSCDLTEMRADNIDESTMLKQIKNKLDEKNIPIETLLAEFERLEDIEDKKVQIEYNNVFNKGVKSVEDKIKAKIEFIKSLKEKLYYEENVISILQSLLEKEE